MDYRSLRRNCRAGPLVYEKSFVRNFVGQVEVSGGKVSQQPQLITVLCNNSSLTYSVGGFISTFIFSIKCIYEAMVSQNSLINYLRKPVRFLPFYASY